MGSLCESATRLCVVEFDEVLVGVVEILAHLLSPVEDRTVSIGAEHLLHDAALTGLTLCPQSTEHVFQVIHPRTARLSTDGCLAQGGSHLARWST